MLFSMAGCANTQTAESIKTAEDAEIVENFAQNREVNISQELSYEGSMELVYADRFAIDYYENDFTLLTIASGEQYLIVPEGEEAPADLQENIKILQQPIEDIYLVATAAMDMVCELEALDAIRFSSQRSDGWCREEASKAMEAGEILYAGKYNMPDYELILSQGCSLAIENNMISHSPEVIEKMESFGIPVFIDYSSYENHPLGRVEWIKVYGALLQETEKAQEAFQKQVEILERVTAEESTGKTVAFFYITTNGMVNVRVSTDYVPKMIELAGGKYIFDNLGEEGTRRSSVTMQMEEFYSVAKDADYLIYNSNIDGEMESIEQLLEKDEILEDFKAVQEGNVWCITKDLYQQSMSIGVMIEDIHKMLSEDETQQEDMNYIFRVR